MDFWIIVSFVKLAYEIPSSKIVQRKALSPPQNIQTANSLPKLLSLLLCLSNLQEQHKCHGREMQVRS